MKAFPKQLSVTEGEIQCAYFLTFSVCLFFNFYCSRIRGPPLSVVPPTTSPLSLVPPTTSSLGNIVPPTTSQLRAVPPPTTLEVVPSFCRCRTRCHSQKSCPCKKLKVLCTVQCHPGHVYELQNIFNSGRKCRLNTENA